jgi:hypothetical protein
LEGKRLPLNITWSGTEISHFRIDRFRFQDKFQVDETSIDFDGAEKEAQELVRKARVSFLPLFAIPRMLHGIVLSKIRGIRTYRRLGVVEIALKNSIGAGDRTEGLESVPEMPWNETAVGLLRHIREQQYLDITLR